MWPHYYLEGRSMCIDNRQRETDPEASPENSLVESLKSLVLKQTEIQTLIFDKARFTRQEAIEWAREHDFRTDKVDETSSSYRLRQKEPSEFLEGSFRTIELTTGVKAVIGRPKASKAEKEALWNNLFA